MLLVAIGLERLLNFVLMATKEHVEYGHRRIYKKYFYAPTLIDRGFIVFSLSACAILCLQKLKLAISFDW